MLLAAHPEWQACARARAEVLEICWDSLPDANMLRNIKNGMYFALQFIFIVTVIVL